MHGARAGDHEQPVVGAVKHGAGLGPGALDCLCLLVKQRQLIDQRGR